MTMDQLTRLRIDGSADSDIRMNRIYDILLSRHIAPGILIDEKRQVLHLFGKANRFLHPPEGRLNNELTNMVGENLRSIFSSLIHSTFASNQSVTLRNLMLEGDYQADISSELIVDPISKARYLLLTISDHAPRRIPSGDAGNVPVACVELDNEIQNLAQSLEVETTQWLEENIRQRTQELTASEQRFRQMADSSPVLFRLSDAHGNLTWVNKTWETWTGRDLQTELAGDWLQHIHPDDRDEVRQIFAAHISNTEAFTLEYRLLNAQHAYGWIYHQCSPMLSAEGRIESFLATCTDISWQKERAEEQKRIERKLEATAKLDSLGLMAGGVAHDFNNLLTGILGNIELAQWETSGEHGMLKTVLADARTATLRAADLCKQMLAYSGKGQFTSDNCDLNGITTETLRFISTSIKTGVKVQLELADNLPEISADKVQLQQIIMNLVINAGESIVEAGAVAIRTGITRMEAEIQNSIVNADLPLNGPAVFLEVRDTGVGMTAEELSRAFEPFFTTKFIGRGLGLSAVQGIVKGHQGRLVVNTCKGQGTTMRIILPVFQESRNETIGTSPRKDLSWNSKILIVDDEEIVARTLHRQLDHMRIPAEYVLSGKECVARVSANPRRYDLIILDLTMAGMDGYETFKQLRQINSQLQVVLISGFTEKEATRNFAADDLSGFLAKPISEKSLMDLIRRLRN